MALNFGKLDFSISFNPTSAFPLDARSYFESLEAAQLAAASAEEAGSFKSLYYYGQTIVVVENNVASLYVIQPNKTLTLLGHTLINGNIFTYDEQGKLTLNNFTSADSNTVLLKNDKGEVVWAPYYDTYSKKEIENKINDAVKNIQSLKRKIVSSIAEIELYMANNNDAGQYIFMVPVSDILNLNKYDEYLVIEVKDSDGITTQYIEKFGAWDVDLTDYAKKLEVQEQLDSKVDKLDSSRLITFTEVDKLLNIEPYAQVNFINNISSHFSLGENKTLILNNLEISQINNLESLLNSKVEKIEGYTLLSPSDQKKLDSLIIGNTGDLEISGNVNADKVIGLEQWINEHASTVTGLSENNLNTNLYNKLNNSLLIQSVNPVEFDLTTGNELNIRTINLDKIVGLNEILSEKANISITNSLTDQLNQMAKQLDNYVLQDTYDAEIANIYDILTWKEI